MISYLQDITKVILFILASTLQVTYAEAEEFVIPAEEPEKCVSSQKNPCSLTTGDQPRLIEWEESQWELDRYSVAQVDEKGLWNFFKGMAVVKTKKPLKIHTPFADIFLGNSKVMIHVLENRVRVMSLLGEGVKVVPRKVNEEQYLVPGFQNWYAGIGVSGQEYGVPDVIDFKKYAKDRSKFFLDYQLGFVKELNKVASSVKWAAIMASQMHKDLHERKVASLKEKHQEKILKKKRGIQYNKFLRKLFLQKVQYDY